MPSCDLGAGQRIENSSSLQVARVHPLASSLWILMLCSFFLDDGMIDFGRPTTPSTPKKYEGVNGAEETVADVGYAAY